MVRTAGGATAPSAELSIPVDSPSAGGDPSSFPSSQRSGGAVVKRFTHADSPHAPPAVASLSSRQTDRRGRGRSHVSRWPSRKGSLSGTELCFYCGALGVAALLAVSFLMPQDLMRGERASEIGNRWERSVGELVRFMPVDLLRRLEGTGGLDAIRAERRLGVRFPRLALVVGGMKIDPSSLMLLTVLKSLRELGYSLSVFDIDGGDNHLIWEKMGFPISILNPENCSSIDWSRFDGIILSSLEAKLVVSSLVQAPFNSIPLIWIIQEDILANRLPTYVESGWQHLVSDWKSAFSRAEIVVFPDYTLPMLHSVLDTGNFLVIVGSPADVWAAKVYSRTHSKHQLRRDNGFDEHDLVILLVANSFLYDDLPWDYAAAMHVLGSRFAKVNGLENSVKFAFLCGNSSANHASALQEIALHLGFPHNSIRQYGFDSDVNGVLLMADIVLYASFQDEQAFPSLLLRALSFGVPIIAPDLPIIEKYVVDTVNGLIYRSHDAEALTRALSLLVSDMELSELAHDVAASGKLLSESIALDCIKEYAKLLEHVVHFPSDTILPRHVSEVQHHTLDWTSLEQEITDVGNVDLIKHHNPDDNLIEDSSIVFDIEDEFFKSSMSNVSGNDTQTSLEELPTALDWEEMAEINILEGFEQRELEEVEERMEKTSGSWEYIYNTARKSERKKFEVNERDEGELERIGRPMCIYELYNGPGAWPFLRHGSIYRGISLSKGGKRSRSDDVDAVDRLPLLSNQYYADLLCELGGMLSVANKVDNIHNIPWIGFQSWRAVGRKASLSVEAEKILEDIIVGETGGDVIYFWAKLKPEVVNERESADLSFWTMCDIINNGRCRSVFEEAFRKMYGLSNETAGLPPMPEDGDDWSTLHSWVMPTPSFLEFIMFSRMFVDSLNNVNLGPSKKNTCSLGSSNMEKRHCYCRLLEILVNVWAYHSARTIVYVNPATGELAEQHPIEQRRGLMWVKYFNFTLLKSMDEDLAEEADDGLRSMDGWLWPMTGEVHWQGMLDREREDRYRKKMDKHRKSTEKLLERQKYGYKQKALGG